jgi:hypothetical protein
MTLEVSASSGRAGIAVRCAKMREQICAPNLPLLTKQTSPFGNRKSGAENRPGANCLDRTVRPVPLAGMARIRASLFIGRGAFNSRFPDGSTAKCSRYA